MSKQCGKNAIFLRKNANLSNYVKNNLEHSFVWSVVCNVLSNNCNVTHRGHMMENMRQSSDRLQIVAFF